MNSSKLRTPIAFLTAVLLPVAAFAQQVEVFYIDRGQEVFQNSATTVIPVDQQWPQNGPNNFWFSAGAMVTSGYIDNFKIANSFRTETIPWSAEDGYDLWATFSTQSDMMAAAPADTYTFTGTGSSSSIGSFSHSISLSAYSPLAIKMFTNYNELQSFDPTKDVVIQWQPFTDAGSIMAFIEVDVRYWNGSTDVIVWDSRQDPRHGDFGLPPETISVTIPAGTVSGSPWNNYTVRIHFLRVDNTAEATEFPYAMFAGVTSLNVLAEIHAKQDVPVRLFLPTGQWTHTERYGWVFGLSPDWGYSFALGYINVANTPDWLYQSNLGWIYCIGNVEAGMWFYHPVKGWLFTTGNYGGYYVNLVGAWANMISP